MKLHLTNLYGMAGDSSPKCCTKDSQSIGI